MISVEYSKSQKCLHVDDLQRAVKTNREKFLLGKDNDWEIIAVFDTMEEADNFANKVWNEIIAIRDYKKVG